MSRYEELEAFVRTIEAGSFTQAANQLNLAKSAVSRRIQDLETRLGTQLIVRTTRKLSLTEAGRSLLERARILLYDWQEVEASAAANHAALAGTIRVSAPLTFGIEHLSSAFIEFMDIHPNVDLDIDFNDRKSDLVSDGIDVAIRIGRLPDSGLISRKIASIKIIASASPDYLAKYDTPQTPNDLKEHKELRYGLKDHQNWTFQGPNGETGQIEMKSSLKSTNGEFLKTAAIAGKGIVILPTFVVYNEIKSGKLIPILRDYKWPELNAHAIYPPTRHLSARVRKLVDHLVEHCGGTTPYWDDI